MMWSHTCQHSGKDYIFRLPPGTEDRPPQWDPERSEHPPVSAGRALELCQQFITGIPMRSEHVWEFVRLSLVECYGIWFWQALWEHQPTGEGALSAAVPAEMICIVLFDETVIEPEILPASQAW